MSGKAPKRKGSTFERDVCAVLRDAGFGEAARITAGANDDRGDIGGVPGLVIECKNRASVAEAVRLAVDEATEAQAVVGAPWSVGVVKRRGRGAEGAYAVMPLAQFAELYLYLTAAQGAQT